MFWQVFVNILLQIEACPAKMRLLSFCPAATVNSKLDYWNQVHHLRHLVKQQLQYVWLLDTTSNGYKDLEIF